MQGGNLIKSLSFWGSVLLVISCSTGQINTQSNVVGVPSPDTKAEGRPSATEVSRSHSAIRLVDFNNIAYPHLPDYSGDERRGITLKAGEGRPDFINYGDTTGDGLEEAMIVLGLRTRGSAISYYAYIFTMEKDQPKVIWDFETGDRADGGLRQVYAENGELVIELYGKGKMIEGDLYAEDGMTGGDCCPTHFTLLRYKWQGNRFQQNGKEEIRSNPVGGAPVVMPRFDSSKRAIH